LDSPYTYLLLNAGCLLFPLLLSFDKRVQFFRSWPALFPAIAFSGAVFIGWDALFTQWGVWSFNPRYLTGIYLGPLPLEECLFFLTVPYACVFIYACVKTYFPHLEFFHNRGRLISWVLVLLLVAGGGYYHHSLYTVVTFSLLAGWLLLNLLVWKPAYLGHFYAAYLLHLIPFFLINGLLTSLPVVMYNDAENIGLRLGSIPLEDSMYSMLLLLMTINVYEYVQKRIADRRALVSTNKIA